MTDQTNSITRDSINNALRSASTGYIARKGEGARVSKSGLQPDVQTALLLVRDLNDTAIAGIASLMQSASVDLLAGLSNISNVKVSKRIVQFLGFIETGDLGMLQGSARTAVYEIAAMLNGATNRETLAFAATGAMREGVNESTLRDVSIARKLRRIGGAVKVGSEQTQNSVTFSEKGICAILGIAKKDSRKSFPVLNESSPVLRALLDRVSKTSEGAIELHIAQREEKGEKKGKRK